MNTRSLILLGCLLAVAAQAATTKREMWVWKDANGVPHYSDVPAPGARRIEIVGTAPSAPSTPSDSLGPTGPSQPEGTAEGSRPESESAQPPYVHYDTLRILSPEDEQSFFNADGSVPVQLESSPELAQGDRLVLYLDGKPADASENAYQTTVNGVERGEHVLTATILDPNGERKIDSAPRKFYMHPNAVNNPRNVGPALKPKPVPAPAPTPTPVPPKGSK